jgi:FAD binding domain
MMQTVLSKRFSALQARIFGQVLEPSDPEFDKTVQGWSLGHRHHPALMVIAKDTVDVIETVRFAKSNGLKLAVQATGHGFVRDAKDGLLVNVSGLNAVSIDPVAQTATFQPGATWAQVLEAAHEHGLVGLVGDTPSVGATGFVLGGGTGWFSRLYGMGVDSLLGVEIVTSDGELRRVNAELEPELFWALRGGAGGFGVVTSMTLQLYPHKTVTTGQVIFPISHAKAAIQAYREWIKTVPNEISSRIMLLRGPDAPFMPPFVRGRVGLMLQFVYAGSRLEAQSAIAPLLNTPNSLVQLVDEVSPTQLGVVFGAPPAPSDSVGRGDLMNELSDAAIDALLESVSLEASAFYFLEVRHLGGAIAKVSDDSTAFAHRHAKFLTNFRVLLSNPSEQDAAQKYTQIVTQKLQAFTTGSILPNFVVGDEGTARDQAAYPGLKNMRLSMLKARFDRDNTFAYARTPGSRSN